jgi:uncharacterized repeat protein (TIGR01451 family)
VVERLRQVAARSQAGLRALLDRRGADYRSFYVINALLVTGDRALALELAARPEVERIEANPQVRLELPPSQPSLRPGEISGIEWNVLRVNADDVWAAGYTGQGVVVAGQDTGYDWDHPALVNSYRGWNGIGATHDYNWHDAIHSGGGGCGADSPVPCDDGDHGTHTMGTIVGDDGGSNQIGVAPGARWIGCRNMNVGWGTPATYIVCFEFFLAPYPVGGDPVADGRPDLAPHVINNSWTCPSEEGCSWDTLQDVVETVRAAGILVVASAGNAGSGCSTVQDPIAIYEAAFSVGATNSSDGIASFSSRGPVMVDSSGRRKPDVSAPGVSVRSCVPGSGYSSKQGTSMAGPHVVGVAALLWSAAPDLMGNVTATERIIEQTARPRTTSQGCGGDASDQVPNNVYGWGIVDAYAAVRQVLGPVVVAKRASFPVRGSTALLEYTITATNISTGPLGSVVMTDAIPAGTLLAGASGVYTEAGGEVSWAPASLGVFERLTVTLVLSVGHLPPGTVVTNDRYGLRSSELITAVLGTPVETVIPYRFYLPVVIRE